MSRIAIAYVTAKDKSEALTVGRALVEKRLAACINVWENMESLYWWEGKIESSTEAVLLVKTTEDKVETVVQVVKALHSYSVPCVISWSVEKGNPDYLAWLDKNVR